MLLLPLLSFLSPLTFLPFTHAHTNSTPTVNLPYAHYAGYHNSTSNLDVFLGVRYADTTIGRNRWRRAQPPMDERSKGRMNATVQPKQCPQATSGGVINATIYNPLQTVDDEDCLFLNVYRPPGAKDLPVLVWIHGGSYDHNSARDFDPTPMIINSNSSFIGVIIQMRLGAFGFLAPPSPSPSSMSTNSSSHAADAHPNVGITDAQYALQWVQSHINLFGGDPSKVTIWGQSSGGGTILQLVNGEYTRLSEGTNGNGNENDEEKGLFRSVVVSSPYLVPMGMCESNGTSAWEQQFQNFSRAANCTGPDPVGCLRNASTETLRLLNHQFDSIIPHGHSNPYSPCIESNRTGSYITRNTAEVLYQGKGFENIYVLGGNNYNDGSSFVPITLLPPSNSTLPLSQTSNTLLTTYLSTTTPLTLSQINQTLSIYYPYEDFTDNRARGGAIFQDLIFGCGVNWLAGNGNGNGNGNGSKSGEDSWRYLFADGTGVHATDNAWEFPYQYNTLEPFSPTAYASYISPITSFIRSNPPNPNTFKSSLLHNESTWPAFGMNGEYKVMNLTSVAGFGNVSSSYIGKGATQIGTKERCDFWAKVRSDGGW